MLEYLIARENEEMLRASKRTYEFPDGETRTLETYRLVWNWFDRIVEAPDTFSEARLIELTQMRMNNEGEAQNEAVAKVIYDAVKAYERCNWDLTNDTLQLDEARRRMAEFKKRNKKRSA